MPYGDDLKCLEDLPDETRYGADRLEAFVLRQLWYPTNHLENRRKRQLAYFLDAGASYQWVQQRAHDILMVKNGFATVREEFEATRAGDGSAAGPALGGDGSAAGPARGKKRLSEGPAPTGEEAMGGGPALGGNMGGGPDKPTNFLDLTHSPAGSPAKKHKGGSPVKNRNNGFTTLRDVTMRALDRSGIADYIISEKGAGEKERALVTFLKALMADP